MTTTYVNGVPIAIAYKQQMDEITRLTAELATIRAQTIEQWKEKCAKVAENHFGGHYNWSWPAKQIAAAIRGLV